MNGYGSTWGVCFATVTQAPDLLCWQQAVFALGEVVFAELASLLHGAREEQSRAQNAETTGKV